MTNGYPYGSSAQVHPICKGPKLALKIGNTHIFGAGLRDAEDSFNYNLIIRINDSVPPFPEMIFNNAAATKALPKSIVDIAMPPMLHLVWPDFSAPTIPVKWWDNLYGFLKEKGKAKKKPYRVLFYCIGGRGRTGSALAILQGLKLRDEGIDEDPVKMVREIYCDTAVESNSQIEYIEAVTGLVVNEVSAFEIEWKRKKANEHNKTVMTANHSGGFRETDWITIDDEGEYYVNGTLYTGNEEIPDDRVDGYQSATPGKPVSRDFGNNEQTILNILKGKGTRDIVAGGPPSSETATPDYEGPAHRVPLQQQRSGKHGDEVAE